MSRRPEPPEPAAADVAVVGAGASGVAAARAAAATLGPEGRVVIVGDARPGGSARLVADGGVLRECAERGLDWRATVAHLAGVRRFVDDRSREAALRAEGIDWLPGRGRLLGNGLIAIEALGPTAAHVPTAVRARRIVLATGDTDRVPVIDGLAGTPHLTISALLGLDHLPETVVVVGGGPAGCEVAQALVRFGVHVTLVEAAGRLLPGEPEPAAEEVTQALREDGVRVFTGAPVTAVAPTLDGGAWVGTRIGDVAAERLVFATGRRAAVATLDLPAAGVPLTPDGWVAVGGTLETPAPGILAVGRVTGLLPHGTSDAVMAHVAGVNAASRKARRRWTPDGLPRVVRTEPGVAVVGLDPQAAHTVPGARISEVPYGGLDRALLSDRRRGSVTLVAGPPGRRAGVLGRGGEGAPLLGAMIVGSGAGELADIVAVALRAGLTVEELAEAPLSSRTWGSVLHHAAVSPPP